jgi:Tol biopolymer transport system component
MTQHSPPPPAKAKRPDKNLLVRPDGTVINTDLIYSSPGEGRVGVYVELLQLSVAPGNKTTVPITVINQGSVVDHFRVSVEGVPPEWMPASRSSVVQLAPGEQHNLKLVIQPPRLPQSRAGHYPLLIHVTSQDEPDQTVEVKVKLWVTAYSEFNSSLTPHRIMAKMPAQIKVQNQGNTQGAFTVAWEDPAEQLEFAPPQTQVSIPPGETSVIEFLAAPRRRRLIGGMQAHSFTAQVSSTTGESQAHLGEIVSKGLIPPWVLLVALFACGLLFSMIALAFSGPGEEAVSATQTAIANKTALANVAVADPDGDGLTNAEEITLKTDPANPDTDGDGLSDGDEIKWGSDPLIVDTDGDTIPDGREIHELKTSPINPDTDGDGLNDNVDPDPVGLPSATPLPATVTATIAPSQTPPPTNTAAPTASAAPPSPTLTPAPPTVTFTPQPSSTPSAGGAGLIVFQSQRDGNTEVYMMNADGSAQTRLTNNTADDFQPLWSPDGGHITFVSARDGNNEIYVMNADGSAQTRLTDNSADDTQPAWSPFGTRLAFVSARDGNNEIYVMNADGSAQTRLTDNSADDMNPAWSPDGTRLAFLSSRDGNTEIYVMNADGSAQTRLTNNTFADCCFAWSPNGARLAFLSDRDGNSEIYVMNADGSAQTRLTNHPALDSGPLWSPDGTRIAFISARDGNSEIYVMNANGSAQTRLTNHPATDCCFVWSPDGLRIAFATDRDGNFEIYVALIDSAGGSIIQSRLTSNLAYDAPSMWRR